MRRAVEKAASIRTRACSCCGIHIDLFDARGEVFASASFGPDVAQELSGELAQFAAMLGAEPPEPVHSTAH